jgi:hypothetical protein
MVITTTLCQARSFLWSVSVPAKPDEKALLIHLGILADPDSGDVTCRYADLAAAFMTTERTIRGILSRLVDKGYALRLKLRMGRAGGVCLRLALDTQPSDLPLATVIETRNETPNETPKRPIQNNETRNETFIRSIPEIETPNETLERPILWDPDPEIPGTPSPVSILKVTQLSSIPSVGFPSSPPNGKSESQLDELASGDWIEAWSLSDRDLSELIFVFRHHLDETSIKLAVDAFVEREQDNARRECYRTGRRPPKPRSLKARAAAWLDREKSWRPHRNGSNGRVAAQPAERDEEFLSVVRADDERREALFA